MTKEPRVYSEGKDSPFSNGLGKIEQHMQKKKKKERNLTSILHYTQKLTQIGYKAWLDYLKP